MTKAPVRRRPPIRAIRPARSDRGSPHAAGPQPDARALAAADDERFSFVMAAAARSGLLAAKSGRIAGRVSPGLVAEAKRRTGIVSDSDLIAFALANVALEDDFAAAFKAAGGAIDPTLDLGFEA